jgi:putative peptide zinc metalloprotease protein
LITDPLTLKHFRFEDEEYFLLSGLNGQTTAEELIAQFHERFAPQRLSQQDLQQLLGQLHRSGLVLSDRSGQGAQLFRRGRKLWRQRFRQQLANPLAIRFRGIDPEFLLACLEPWTRWLFSPLIRLAAGLLMITALTLILTNFEQFWSRLPGMHEFFAGRNWLSLALVLGATKVCHELGHALTSRRYGGQCPELGLMLLVFTPCLYANVSDSWRLTDKWKRMAISFAGIYVELLLAGMATIIWWASQPGLINQLALNVMFVCSVGTLLFNANPLMKYDGYYLLADWLEIPNLRQRASSLVSRSLSHWLVGLPFLADPWQSQTHRGFLWAYALSASLYRWLMTFGVVWFLYQLLDPWGLKIIGQSLAAAALLGLCVAPARQAFLYFSVPGRWNAMNRPRLALTAAIGLALSGILLWLPLPHSVRCPFYLQPANARQVYVETAGMVAEVMAQPGERVEAGQPLVRLHAPELAVELARLEGDVAASEAQLKIAQTWSSSDEAVAAQIPAVKTAALAAQKQLVRKQLEASQLTVVAPASGTLLPAHRRPSPTLTPAKPEQWTGQPLRSGQLGHFLESQTALGTICLSGQEFEAVLLVSQDEIEPVLMGQLVRLWMHAAPGKVFQARTGELSAQPVVSIPAALTSKFGGEIPTQTDSAQREQPLSPCFQVAAIVTSPQPNASSPVMLSGGTGVAYIHVGYRSLGSRLWRWMLQTFHFEL